MKQKKTIYFEITWKILFLIFASTGAFIFLTEAMSWNLYYSIVAVVPAFLTSVVATIASIPFMRGEIKSLDQLFLIIKSNPEIRSVIKGFFLKGPIANILMFLGIALGIYFIIAKSYAFAILWLGVSIISTLLFFSQLKKVVDSFELYADSISAKQDGED